MWNSIFSACGLDSALWSLPQPYNTDSVVYRLVPLDLFAFCSVFQNFPVHVLSISQASFRPFPLPQVGHPDACCFLDDPLLFAHCSPASRYCLEGLTSSHPTPGPAASPPQLHSAYGQSVLPYPVAIHLAAFLCPESSGFITNYTVFFNQIYIRVSE